MIGTVGSDDKIALAKENGCAHVLNTRSDDWVKRVREITGGEGVPVVYDSIGKDTFAGSLDCLAVRGMMVSFGNASGAVPAFEPGILSAKGSLYLTRPTLVQLHAHRAGIAGNGRRSLRRHRLGRGENRRAPALQTVRRAQGARGAAFARDDGGHDPDSVSVIPPPSGRRCA